VVNQIGREFILVDFLEFKSVAFWRLSRKIQPMDTYLTFKKRESFNLFENRNFLTSWKKVILLAPLKKRAMDRNTPEPPLEKGN
jgi:hypothetical protein